MTDLTIIYGKQGTGKTSEAFNAVSAYRHHQIIRKPYRRRIIKGLTQAVFLEDVLAEDFDKIKELCRNELKYVDVVVTLQSAVEPILISSEYPNLGIKFIHMV